METSATAMTSIGRLRLTAITIAGGLVRFAYVYVFRLGVRTGRRVDGLSEIEEGHCECCDDSLIGLVGCSRPEPDIHRAAGRAGRSDDIPRSRSCPRAETALALNVDVAHTLNCIRDRQ